MSRLVLSAVCTAACDVRSTLDKGRLIPGQLVAKFHSISTAASSLDPGTISTRRSLRLPVVYFKHTTYTLASSCRSVAVKKLPGIAAPSESLTEACFLSVAGAEVAGLTSWFDAAPSLSRPRREPTRTRPSRELAAS